MTASTLSEDSLSDAAWMAGWLGKEKEPRLEEAHLAGLAPCLARKDVERGGVLFSAGSDPSGVWILRSGVAELVVGSGARRRVVHLLHPGDADGDVQLLLGRQFAYTARATEDVKALFVDAGAFKRLLGDQPPVARLWLSIMANRIGNAHARICGLLAPTLEAQVASLLMTESEAGTGKVRLPQRTLAAMLAVQRPSLNRVLKELERRGYISLGYGQITIVDRRGVMDLTLLVG